LSARLRFNTYSGLGIDVSASVSQSEPGLWQGSDFATAFDFRILSEATDVA